MKRTTLAKPDMLELTARERSVAVEISVGGDYAHIARQLGIDVETVRSYATRLRRKTGALNKSQLTIWAINNLQRLKRANSKIPAFVPRV